MGAIKPKRQGGCGCLGVALCALGLGTAVAVAWLMQDGAWQATQSYAQRVQSHWAPNTTVPPTEPPVQVPADLARAGSTRWYYQRLSVAEQQYYNNCLQQLLSFVAKIPADGNSAEAVGRVFQALVYDQPLLFHVSGTQYQTNTVGGSLVEWQPQYRMTRETYLSRCAELLQAIRLPTQGDAFSRELQLHDSLVRACRYSEEAGEDRNTVYGALVLGRATCEGYARAMLLLCELSGIPAGIATGEADNRAGFKGGHAWNQVQIDGDWYHLDATWDDPVVTDGSDILSHAYFNLTSAEIGQTHERKPEQVPCTATRANYFVRQGLRYERLTRADEAGLAQGLVALLQAKESTFEFRMATPAALQQATTYLFEEQRIYAILRIAAEQVPGLQVNNIYHAEQEGLAIIRLTPEVVA